ncbi:hypothetical protein GCM10010230_28810 [Streptomyces narbonensis]|nr:hypothetical protein GCM10010230_28810 [Streptomyces narbonensis]
MPLEERLQPSGRAVAHAAPSPIHPPKPLHKDMQPGGGRERRGKRKMWRGDRRTPGEGGRDDGGPREGHGPGSGPVSASAASMETREPLRKSLTPTNTNVPDAC